MHGIYPQFDTRAEMKPVELNQLFMLSDEQTSNKYRCETCGKLYKWKQGLRNHVRLECGKPPQFHCTVCTYKTHRKENLIRHCLLLHKMNPYMK
jgi:rubredoxin